MRCLNGFTHALSQQIYNKSVFAFLCDSEIWKISNVSQKGKTRMLTTNRELSLFGDKVVQNLKYE